MILRDVAQLNNKDMINAVKRQLAIDLSCNEEDFKNNVNTVVLSSLNEKRRRFINEKPFCHMASFGNGAVASVDEKVFDWYSKFASGLDDYRCFDGAQVMVMNRELSKHNMCLASLGEYSLPDLNFKREANAEYEIRILHKDEIPSLYDDDRFGMALSYEVGEEFSDIIAAVAYENGNIMGVAAASNDSDSMYQLGIDVLPQYRRKGIAVTLTNVLTEVILRMGKIPYVGACWANVASRKVARECGYFPTWVEMTAFSLEGAEGFANVASLD